MSDAEDKLRQIANIAHHGGLTGYDEFSAMEAIRKISIDYWDKKECERLQREKYAKHTK